MACPIVGVTGAIVWIWVVEGLRLALEVCPAAAIARPPGRIDPEKAACRDCCSVTYLEMFTEEIENSTMNNAISSVIMSA